MNATYTRKELEMLRSALTCILQEENPLPEDKHRAREAEICRRIHGGLGVFEDSDGSVVSDISSCQDALDRSDLRIMSRLLQQVNHLVSEEDKAKAFMDLGKLNISPHSRRRESDGVVEAAVEIVEAAAEVAKAAAISTGKNIELMESYLENANKQQSPDSESLEKELSALYDMSKDAEKNIKKQNTITHWILGFMVIATAIWRFKLVSIAMGVRKKIKHPIQTLGDVVTEKLKVEHKEGSHSVNPFHDANLVLPSILGTGTADVKDNAECHLDHDS